MIYFCSHSVSAQSLLSCPRFTEGRKDSIKLTVAKPAYSSTCISPLKAVTFYFQPKDNAIETWCTAHFKDCPNTGTPLPACRKCTCECEIDDANTTVFSLHFTPIAADLGGRLSHEVNCLHLVDLPPNTDENCFPISLGKLLTSSYYYVFIVLLPVYL